MILDDVIDCYQNSIINSCDSKIAQYYPYHRGIPCDKGGSHTKAHNKYQGRKPLVIAA